MSANVVSKHPQQQQEEPNTTTTTTAITTDPNELIQQLHRAHSQITALLAERDKWKNLVINVQLTAEREEELIANKLLKNIDELKQEKQRLLELVEKEEKLLMLAAQKKLDQVRQQTVNLEVDMEREQEYLVNRLQREIHRIAEAKDIALRKSSVDTSYKNAINSYRKTISAQDEEIKRLKVELHTQTGRISMLERELEQMKHANAQQHVIAELQEEKISNTLLRRIADLKRDKENLLKQVEQEEEYLTNTLTKKVAKLMEENKELEAALREGRSHMLQRYDQMLSPEDSQTMFTMEQDTMNFAEPEGDVDKLREEIKKLRAENFLLKGRILRDNEKLENATNDRVRLETDLELSEERMFNSGDTSRSRSASTDQRSRSASIDHRSRSGSISEEPPEVFGGQSPPRWWTRRSK